MELIVRGIWTWDFVHQRTQEYSSFTPSRVRKQGGIIHNVDTVLPIVTVDDHILPVQLKNNQAR